MVDTPLFPDPPRQSVYDLHRAECQATAKLFGGATFDEAQDGNRLRAQLDAVRTALSDGDWHTLADLETRTGAPQASVSARLRDLRKPQFGGHTVERQRVVDGHGLHAYRLVRVPHDA